jgi:predicted phosphodiesterase
MTTAKLKIAICSDLHLEFSDIDIPNTQNANVLILSGDIMLAERLAKPESKVGIRFREFLERVSAAFPHVIYVAGNHEFYGGYFHKSIDSLRTECAKYNNIYFLENDTKIIDDVVFIGATVWTDMNRGDPITLHAVRDMMNDYQTIRNDQQGYIPIKPADTMERHRRTLSYFRLVLSENKDKKCVVVGHHSPSFLSCHPMYTHDYIMNGAYHSDLSEFILDHPQIQLWTHGHTHHPFDYTIETTRIVCNPRGYEGYEADTGWNPEFCVDL